MLGRFWNWLRGWFRSKPAHLEAPPFEDLTPAQRKHWRESFPHNLKVRRKPLMESGEAYRYTRDDKRQIRRKLPKGGKK